MPTPAHATRSVQRRDLARRLSSLLDEVVFNIEHGIPLSVVNDLSSLGRSLEALRLCGGTAGELRSFREAVDALRAVEPDAVDRLLCAGERVFATLKDSRVDPLAPTP
jgi:hypothetical protein